jgi:hypothetical protein
LTGRFETTDGIWCNGARKDKVIDVNVNEIEIRFKVQFLFILQKFTYRKVEEWKLVRLYI